MFRNKNKLLYLWTEVSESLQEFLPAKPSHIGVVVTVSVLQLCTKQSPLKLSCLNRTGNLCCYIHYLFYILFIVVIKEVGEIIILLSAFCNKSIWADNHHWCTICGDRSQFAHFWKLEKCPLHTCFLSSSVLLTFLNSHISKHHPNKKTRLGCIAYIHWLAQLQWKTLAVFDVLPTLQC